MSWASVSQFGSLLDSSHQVWMLVESTQRFKDLYLSLASQVLVIIKVGWGLVCSVSGKCDWGGYISGYGTGGLGFQLSSTIKSPYVCIFTSQYPFWYDLRCYQDVKPQQLPNLLPTPLIPPSIHLHSLQLQPHHGREATTTHSPTPTRPLHRWRHAVGCPSTALHRSPWHGFFHVASCL